MANNIFPGFIFFNISINNDTTDFVINLFLTNIKLPVCRLKILFSQRYGASCSDSPLIKENTLNEFILLQSIKMLSMAELETLVIPVGKSIM
jgi:hypothetical protein